MNRTRLALFAVVFGGCDFFEGVKDTVEGVVNRNVAIGVVTTLEASVQELGIDDEAFSQDLPPVFLADATSVTDLDNAPISGAEGHP